MAECCTDTTCRSYFKGEIVPLIVEIYTEDEDNDFNIVIEETKCVIVSQNGNITYEATDCKSKQLAPNKHRIFASWNTEEALIGYYEARFWIAINFFGARNSEGLIVDYKICSDAIRRYVKAI